MAEVKKSAMAREAIKAIVGNERYSSMAGHAIFVDRHKDGTVRVKVQHTWAGGISEDEEAKVVAYIEEKYGQEVRVEHGRSGSRMLYYTAFYF